MLCRRACSRLRSMAASTGIRACTVHWLLVRLLRLFPTAPFAKDARAALSANLTPKNIAGEVDYVKNEARASFERPYGLAWLLQLSAELRSWDDSEGQQLAAALAPLETLAASKLKSWLPEAALSDPGRRARSDRVFVRFDVGLGAHCGGCPDEGVARGCSGAVLSRRSQLPAQLRAVGAGLSVALPGRGGFHAAGARARGVRDVARGVSAADSNRKGWPSGGCPAW